MRTLICKTLFLVLLPLLTGWANAAMLSSEVRSLSYMAACADGSGGLWLLVGESAGGWANDDFLSVSAWHASAAGEPRRIGAIPLSEDDGGDPVSTFASCQNVETGAVAHVQTGSSLAELRLTMKAATLRRRIDLVPLQERDAGFHRLWFVGTVKGALVIATPSIWLEGGQGFELVKPDPTDSPQVARTSFSSTAEHLYYVETITPPEVFAPRGGEGAVHAHRIRLVQETLGESGWGRSGQSAPLDIPGRSPDNETGFPPGHFTMVESGRFHVLSYYLDGDRLILHSGSGTSAWGDRAEVSGDTAGLVRLDTDRRQVVEGVDLGWTVRLPWAKLAGSLYFAHAVQVGGRMRPFSLRVVRADAEGQRERLDIPLPSGIRSSSGISPTGIDIVASGDRLYAISTVSGPFDGEEPPKDVVVIDRLR